MCQFNIRLPCVGMYTVISANINTKLVLKYRDFHHSFNSAYSSQKLLCDKGKCIEENTKIWTYITFSKTYKSLIIRIYLNNWVTVPFNQFRLHYYSSRVFLIQQASSQCFPPDTKDYAQFMPCSWCPPSRMPFCAIGVFYNPTHLWEQRSSPTSSVEPSPISQLSFFCLCPLNSLSSWLCASQLGTIIIYFLALLIHCLTCMNNLFLPLAICILSFCWDKVTYTLQTFNNCLQVGW